MLCFGFGVAGLFLQKLLPQQHTTDRSRDMIAAIVGLISLLLALVVLGTLVGSAHSFYLTQQSEMEAFSVRALRLNLALAEYGPETAPMRSEMKEMYVDIRKMLWGGNANATLRALSVTAPLQHLEGMDEYVASLDPKTSAQRQYMSSAASYAAAIEHTRLLMSLQLVSPVSWPLVAIVVSWAMILFCGFGVLSRINATTLVALGFGAFAVGSALFLILELSQPFTGVFRAPSTAYDDMLGALK